MNLYIVIICLPSVEMDSNVNKSDDCSQHEEDGYVSENELCYNEYELEELYNSSRCNSCHDENGCCNNVDFPNCYTNAFSIVSSSCYLDNNHS